MHHLVPAKAMRFAFALAFQHQVEQLCILVLCILFADSLEHWCRRIHARLHCVCHRAAQFTTEATEAKIASEYLHQCAFIMDASKNAFVTDGFASSVHNAFCIECAFISLGIDASKCICCCIECNVLFFLHRVCFHFARAMGVLDRSGSFFHKDS